MLLPRSSAIAARLDILERAGSTNDELRRAAAGPHAGRWPSFSVIATDTQTAGRGRLGRTWSAPPGTALAASLLLRTDLGPSALGWLPLIAGLAMSRALTGLGAAAELKWPNDILIGGRKVCGILAELIPGGVIVGTGVNLTLREEQLPVPTATSLALAGVDASADAVLAAYLAEMRGELAAFESARGDADASGVRDRVRAACGTLGRAVRVELPTGGALVGTATDLDADGRLLFSPAPAGAGGPAGSDNAQPSKMVAVTAGDVTHLRYF
ncbi:MAG TPA: biotin--[acetyl-CoA-carboxylase] ligase [Naasia sp.]